MYGTKINRKDEEDDWDENGLLRTSTRMLGKVSQGFKGQSRFKNMQYIIDKTKRWKKNESLKLVLKG